MDKVKNFFIETEKQTWLNSVDNWGCKMLSMVKIHVDLRHTGRTTMK